ncbi:hypothetical protein [Paraburkholderia sp. 40]|uniref:hypothetical protein n=1 Tax=unclassified Paraburkholderia TaxID=2615204 RepID=UPI003D1D99C7
MNSSVQSAPGYLQMTFYAFWALTLIFAVVTLLVFRRKTELQNSGIEKGAWIAIVLAILLQLASLLLGGRLVSFVFHIISLIVVCTGLFGFSAYAAFLVVTGQSRKRNVSG